MPAKMNKTEKGRTLLKWLREAREKQGMTMRETGARMKLPHTWVGKIENGDRRLDVLEYVKYCQVIGADPVKGLKLLEKAKR